MRKFSDLIIAYKGPIIVFVIVMTALLAYSLKDIKVNSDILSYLPESDPLVVLFNEVGDKFGGNSLAMVALEADDIFNHDTLSRVRQLTQAYEKVEGVTDVISLTNILDIKKIEGGLEVGKLIDKRRIPESQAELAALKEYTLSKDMYVGSLVSRDGTLTTIICRIKEDTDKLKVAEVLKQLTEETPGREKVYYAGIPFQMIDISKFILGDMSKLTPIVALLVMLILYFSFRSFRGIFLPLGTVFISLVWVLGVMGAAGYSITLVSGIMPVLLIAVGSAYGIHMLSKYYEDVKSEADKEKQLKNAMREVGMPIVLAGLTTMIGFLALMSSTLSLIKEFGFFTAIGILFAVIISTTFLPAFLAMLRVKKVKANKKGTTDTAITRGMDRLGAFVLNREKMVLIIAVFISIGAMIGLPRLKREVNMVEYFKKDSDIRIAEELMQNKLGGSIPVQIYVQGDIKNPFVLKQMRMAEKYLESLPDVNDPQSVADLICEMNRVMNDRYTIPPTEEGVGNLWFFVEGNEILDQMVNTKNTKAIIQAKLGTVETGRVIELVDKVDKYLHDNVSRDFVVLDLREVSPELRTQLERDRAERIADMVAFHLRAVVPDYQLDKDRLQKIVMAGGDAALFDARIAQDISDRIGEYFASDEADIEVDSQETIGKIQAAFMEKLKSGNPSLDEIEAILGSTISKAAIAEDPDAIGYAALSIESIIEEGKKEARVQSLISKLDFMIPTELKSDEGFMDDLRSDLWEINENQVSMDYARYREIAGANAKPPETIHLSVQQAGLAPIFKKFDTLLVRSQVQSLLISLVIVFIILAIQFRSVIGGLISVVPIVLTILINFGVMSYLGVPLDDATIMVGSIAIGIGIDYTIHFTFRFRKEFARRRNELEALDKTLEATGVAIAINAISVAAGFLVLLMSNIVPLQRFGWLTALTMFTSALASVTVLPALILITKAKFMGLAQQNEDSGGIEK